jgi:hypothetical protein
MENIVITEYSLFEFLSRSEKAINNGYAFDFSTNQNFPTAFGNMYYAIMVPKEETLANCMVESVPLELPLTEEQMTKVASEEELVLNDLDVVEAPTSDSEPTPARRGRPAKKTAPD